MAKAASVTSGLVKKKGEAVPSSAQFASSEVSPRSARVKGMMYYKSLTVKLDHQRYEALKYAGIRLNRKSQDIFVEALDLWLESKSDPQIFKGTKHD